MKSYLFVLLLFLTFVFPSCDKEDDVTPLEYQENLVTWEILASDANAVLEMYSSADKEIIHASSGYKYSFKTTAYGASCRVSCEDYYNKLTLKGYVNGKLREEKAGNGQIQIKLDIK